MSALADSVQLFMWSIVAFGAILVTGMAIDIWNDVARERRLRKWRREHVRPSPNDKSPR